MLKWLSIIALLFQASPAAADPDEFGRADEILRLDDWSLESEEKQSRLTVKLTNVGDKSFRMIDAVVSFNDVLGEDISRIELGRELRASPGEQISYAGVLTAGSGRLSRMRPSTVVTSVQVRAVLYEDGTVKRFG
jgi:hypothetical protein